MDDSLFFASATAPVAEGRAGARDVLVELELTLPVLAWLGALAVVGLAVEVGEVTLEGVAGFLAVEVVEDVVALGLGAAADDIVEVRLAVVPRAEGRRFSSSEAEGADLCAVEDPTADVRFVAVELAVGRVGGLVKPLPVLVRVPEDVVGLVALDDVVAGRRVVVVELVVDAGFLAAVEEAAVLAPVVEVVVFFAGAATGDGAFSVGGAAGGASAGASSCWTTS